ncbi:unnamed protein product [Calicophoron daubneyi]|uniref:2-phosphoxylose phosphatase 1 n=1 Tax=Calicophoron daubneyi TaxID=300641 RepID=A0AAV2T3K5_CALDB
MRRLNYLILCVVVTLYLTLIVGSPIKQVYKEGQIQQLQILFRHGDRVPINEMFDNSTPVHILWPIGMGQLTSTGIRQEFQLGRWFRKQYASFIPPKYNASDVYVRSTDFDRTLMSGQSFLAGLYQCTSADDCPLYPFGISWRPVPIHTVQKSADKLFVASNCPKLKKLHNEFLKSDEVQQYMKKHQDLIHLLQRVTNYPNVSYDQIGWIADTLICMQSNNFTLPRWCTKDLLEEMRKIQYFVWRVPTLPIVQLEIGVFLKQLAETLIEATKRSTPYTESSVKRLLAYAIHDEYLDYLLISLGYLDDKCIEYAGATIFELVGPTPPGALREYRLKLRYKRSWEDEVADYVQILPCKGEPASEGCALDRVIGHLETRWLDARDYDDRCRLDSSSLRQKFQSVGFVLASVLFYKSI